MFVRSADALLNVVDFGSGPALVMHGGWVGSWELWQEPMQILQGSWRCVAYDHRGSGASSPDGISPQALVDDLFRVLDALQIDRCVLAGESLGGLTCLTAVLQEPSRFMGLVLVDAVPATTGTGPDTTAVLADYPAYVDAFVRACVPESDSEHIRRWGRQILLRAEPEAAAQMLQSLHTAALAPDLGAVHLPTLVIHGERDAVVPLAVGKATAAAISNAELVIIPGAGHVPSLTRPHEVADAIASWATRRCVDAQDAIRGIVSP